MVKPISRLEIAAKKEVLDLFSGMYHSCFKGRGLEIEDLREYVPGDDVRAISWNKTAQMGRPFVKNFIEERDLTVLLLVDISASSKFSSLWESKRMKMAQIGALFIFSAIHNRDRVGLILFSSKVEKYIPPKRGIKHGVRLIRELISRKAENEGTDVKAALSFLNKVTRKKVISFLLSDFLDEVPEGELRRTAKKHDLIAIRVLDPLEKEMTPVGLIQLEDMETKKEGFFDVDSQECKNFLEKKKALDSKFFATLARAKVDLVDLETKQEIEKALIRFFKIRKKRL
jgi:uncharacterized protein (DUF58 family)